MIYVIIIIVIFIIVLFIIVMVIIIVIIKLNAHMDILANRIYSCVLCLAVRVQSLTTPAPNFIEDDEHTLVWTHSVRYIELPG